METNTSTLRKDFRKLATTLKPEHLEQVVHYGQFLLQWKEPEGSGTAVPPVEEVVKGPRVLSLWERRNGALDLLTEAAEILSLMRGYAEKDMSFRVILMFLHAYLASIGVILTMKEEFLEKKFSDLENGDLFRKFMTDDCYDTEAITKKVVAGLHFADSTNENQTVN